MESSIPSNNFNSSTVLQNLVDKFRQNYNYVINDLADPRVKNWFFISNFTPTLAIIVSYLALIYVVLPKYMQNRQPYGLKHVIMFYNLTQITICTYAVYKIATPISQPLFSLTCAKMDFSPNNLRSGEALYFCYMSYYIKAFELVETMFFVLRKKHNQVSNLHVYHHVSTLLTAWFFARYFGGRMTLFVMMVNSFIHILMYTYYLISSLGLNWQKKVVKWKSTLTKLQMVQFCILIAYACQAFQPSCNVSFIFIFAFVPNVIINFNLFWNFYKRSYLNKNKIS